MKHTAPDGVLPDPVDPHAASGHSVFAIGSFNNVGSVQRAVFATADARTHDDDRDNVT